MTITYISLYRDLRRAGIASETIRAGWIAVIRAIDDPDAAAALADRHADAWPSCTCVSGCGEPATTIESDGGDLSCEGCRDYCVDEDGDVVCASCDSDRVERVVASCGAGGQTREYYRLTPPEMPEADPQGEWALYWDTNGDDAHVVERYASREDAEQAVTAMDWPPPGDHTHYLCGYTVRRVTTR